MMAVGEVGPVVFLAVAVVVLVVAVETVDAPAMALGGLAGLLGIAQLLGEAVRERRGEAVAPRGGSDGEVSRG